MYKRQGLEGLIAGRCIAAGYRVVDFIQFSSCNVVMINTRYTIQQICISTVFVMLVYFAAHKIPVSYTHLSPLYPTKYAFPGISLSFSCYQVFLCAGCLLRKDKDKSIGGLSV